MDLTENDKLNKIRQAEAKSHIQAYANHELFAAGSWLSRPVKTVLDILPLFSGYSEFRGLDLGCGVGRNSIPVAQHFSQIPCRIDCVDILEYAIDKLHENTEKLGVSKSVCGTVSSIDDYSISDNYYDLVMAISALEHVGSKKMFNQKLMQIRNGIRSDGIVCLIVNTSIVERDQITNKQLHPQFEVVLQTNELLADLEAMFSGWQIIKQSVVHQKYDISRENGVAELEADVVTYVARKKENDNG